MRFVVAVILACVYVCHVLSVVVFLIVGIIMGSGTKGGKERDRRLPIIFYQIDMEYNNDSDII